MSTAAQEAERDTTGDDGVNREVEFTPLGEKDAIKLSISMVQHQLMPPTKSGLTASPGDALKFIMLCRARGLNPWTGDAYAVGFEEVGPQGPVACYNLITSVQSLFKRAEMCPEYDGIQSGIIVRAKQRGDESPSEIEYREGDFFDAESEVLLGGWARVYRKDKSKPDYEAVRLSSFRKSTKIWNNMPESMVSKCFDDKTEVLTEHGFRLFGQVEGRIAQVADGGLELVSARPFSQPYRGEMVHNRSQRLDFCVTPNHDMVLTDGSKIEAGELYEESRRRPKFCIPRTVVGGGDDYPVGDNAIRLAGYLLADGHEFYRNVVNIGVSRERKIAALHSLGLHSTTKTRKRAGSVAVLDGREVRTKKDKTVFVYSRCSLEGLLVGRQFPVKTLLQFSPRQAKLLVDAMAEFDGHLSEGGTQRFYQTKPEVQAVFDVAAVQAGYSLSIMRPESRDGNNVTSLSRKHEWPVVRHASGGLEKVEYDGHVWCVTVPSGKIVVRRGGFSFVCGNCAEVGALRKAFPNQLSGLYIKDEMPESGQAKAASKVAADLDSVARELSQRPPSVPAIEERPEAEPIDAEFTGSPEAVPAERAKGKGSPAGVAQAVTFFDQMKDEIAGVASPIDAELLTETIVASKDLSADEKEFLVKRLSGRNLE